MKTLPDHVKPYQQTPEFTEQTVPAGLLRAHQTKEGVWGRIVILEGRLQYTINEPVEKVVILDNNNHGVVEPTIMHEVKPLGAVRFYVEFYR